LSPETSEDKVKDFFLFCGAISSLKKDGNTADITFQKESAARTALMLNGGTVSVADTGGVVSGCSVGLIVFPTSMWLSFSSLWIVSSLSLSLFPRLSYLFLDLLPLPPPQLDGAHLEVTSASTPITTTGSTSLPMDANASTPIGASSASGALGADEHGIEQEDKPKAGIMAECKSTRRPYHNKPYLPILQTENSY
jgi:hypothetical protein